MTDVIALEGGSLDRVLDQTHPLWHEGLDRHAYGRSCLAQLKTAWGRRFQRRLALVDGADMLASAEQYDLAGRFEERAIRICAIGSVFTEPSDYVDFAPVSQNVNRRYYNPTKFVERRGGAAIN